MIDAIVGHKGSGKTARLVREITEAAAIKDSNIVCIEYGKRFDRNIPYTVRLIDILEFTETVHNYDGLLAFIAGINAKDYDISHFYIDSIYKVAQDSDQTNLAKFIRELDAFSKKFNVTFIITISEDPECLHEDVKSYIRTH